MTTIDRPTRQALHAGLVLDLSGLSNLWALLDQNRAGEARRLRERFEQDWRLLDDLGWEVADPRQSFELTMPPGQLAQVVRRLHRAGPRLSAGDGSGALGLPHVREPASERSAEPEPLAASTGGPGGRRVGPALGLRGHPQTARGGRPRGQAGGEVGRSPRPVAQPTTRPTGFTPVPSSGGLQASDLGQGRADRGRCPGRGADDDQDRDCEPGRDHGADRPGRRGRLRPGPRRGAPRGGRRGAEDDRRRVADPGDRRHPLQLHAGTEGDRRGRPLHPAQPRQHRRPRQGRAGRRAGHRGRGADADRGQLRLPAQAPPRARALEPGRGAGAGGGRVRRADGAARVRELQGLDQVDQRPQHDRRQPAAGLEDRVPDPPRDHRGGDQVVGVAEVGGRARDPARRRGGRHDPDQPLHLSRRGGGEGRLGDPQGARPPRARAGADRLSDLRPAPVRHGHRGGRDRAAAWSSTPSRSRSRCSAAR